MAFTRMTIDGYGQLELNQVAFPRDGRIEAQCALDATDFADVPAENGMLLAVDRVNRTVKFPKSAVVATCPVALNYTTEHMYDERANGLKDFKINYREDGEYFYPRMGYLSVGDLFTTNTISFDSSEFADKDALAEAVNGSESSEKEVIYGGISADGSIAVSATAPQAGPKLRVVKATTMPDGQFALKFQVLKA